MFRGSVVWIPPTLCGCEIRMDANWIDDEDAIVTDNQGRRISYKHPVPFTIRRIDIEKVCAAHESATTGEPDFLPYMDPTGYAGEMVQNRGYIRQKIKYSAAEKLYIYLWRYAGTILRPDTCGCAIPHVHDRLDPEAEPVHIDHPHHMHHCRHHPGGVEGHKQALEEMRHKNKMLHELAQRLPDHLVHIHTEKDEHGREREVGRSVREDKVAWEYDENRQLNLKVVE